MPRLHEDRDTITRLDAQSDETRGVLANPTNELSSGHVDEFVADTNGERCVIRILASVVEQRGDNVVTFADLDLSGRGISVHLADGS